MIASDMQRALQRLTHETGVVIPIYLPAQADAELGAAVIGETVAMVAHTVTPSHVCLSVDGPGPGEAVARQLAQATGVQVVTAAQNGGKFAAVANGMCHLLQQPHLRYLAALDHDGDHFANELLNFVRAAEHVAAATGSERVLVLGNRNSRHRPLGFLRAEQEELANYMTMDALAYAAVQQDRPVRLEFLSTTGDPPDFHSGYKLFDRATAAAVFTSGAPPTFNLNAATVIRHACEAVMVVEAHLAGATLAGIKRSTFDEQPMSLFAAYGRAELAANMILWPCKRLGVPGHFVAQWLANHMPRLLLATLAPQGLDELAAIRERILTAYDIDPANPPYALTRPRFV